jgi:hypothetical protein
MCVWACWGCHAPPPARIPCHTLPCVCGRVGLPCTAVQAGKPLNYLFLLLHRYLRLTPAYLAVLVFLGWVVPHMSSGPHWPYMLDFAEQWCVPLCREMKRETPSWLRARAHRVPPPQFVQFTRSAAHEVCPQA